MIGTPFASQSFQRLWQSSLLFHLREALAAIDRAIRLGLERHSGLAAAGCAGSSEELTRTASGVLASVAAGLAALGLILEAALCIEFLLTGGENELCSTLFALQSLVFVHSEILSFSETCLSAEIFAFSCC